MKSESEEKSERENERYGVRAVAGVGGSVGNGEQRVHEVGQVRSTVRAGSRSEQPAARASRSANQVLVPAGRDVELVRAVWSLGWSTAPSIAGLVCPGTQPRTLRRRLGQLVAAGYLRQTRICLGRGGHLWIYETGPRAGRIADGYRDPWKPSIVQLEHTLAVGDTLRELCRPGRFTGLGVVGWQGEAEIRSWTKVGQPYSDASVQWRSATTSGGWWIELDRGTETSKTWRSKLLRYLLANLDSPGHAVLAVTTSDARALNLAKAGRETGVHILATTSRGLSEVDDPRVLDSHRDIRPKLSAALLPAER